MTNQNNDVNEQAPGNNNENRSPTIKEQRPWVNNETRAQKRKNEEKMKNKDVALTARISARLSSQEIGNHTDIAFQRRGKKVGSKR